MNTREYGTDRKRARRITLPLARRIGQSAAYRHTPAQNAARSSKPNTYTARGKTASAIRIAEPNMVAATEPRGKTSMRIKAIRRAGRADVFNMEVEDTHDFVIQGGVISHNCADETRYLCMMNPMKPVRVKERRPQVFDPLSSDEPRAGRYDWIKIY
jgi:hypothetical protein